MSETLADIRMVAAKEFRGFFANPSAWLFIGAFLAAALFMFFWVDAFFARNIADVRPLFRWLPLLLIFLAAALTMRSWSEERRSGALESLLTAPKSLLSLVLGKFAAALALVALALLLTTPLPLTVSYLGSLDWGPVFGGYVATLFLAAAYIAIGLAMSARTDNPIVALILTTFVCGVFYFIGSDLLISLFGHDVGSVLAQLGAGSRFESITRGVLDVRDLYFYLSIIAVFICLNIYSLEQLRRAGAPQQQPQRLWSLLLLLLAANLLTANLWLAPLHQVRVDISSGGQYSLSSATLRQLQQLQEPLLIRGYFSSKTHPQLAPLAPRIKDLLREYAIAADGRATVEFIDPTRDPDAEEEAAVRYDVRPFPFQTADRYQTAVVNSYFDVVIAYGDQHEKLDFRDLIEVKARGESGIEIALKNPEYAITRAIRKVSSAWRAGDNPFASLTKPVLVHAWFSPDDKLPQQLQSLRIDLEALVEELEKHTDGKLQLKFDDPDAGDGALGRELNRKYGLAPQIASLVDPRPFWFYIMLESGGETVQAPLPETFDKAGLKRSIDTALSRFTPGVLKTVALFAPPQGGGFNTPSYRRISDALRENNRVIDTDLKSGQAPEDADLLLLLAPNNLDDRQRFAVDQFLMQGGSVIIAASPFHVTVDATIEGQQQNTGLDEWLRHNGVSIEQRFVLDPQNTPLLAPVERRVGGLTLREIRSLPYPHLPDIRESGLNQDNPITASLEQITLSWPSPLRIDSDKNSERSVHELLHSSSRSWTSSTTDLTPNYRRYPDDGFAVSGERKQRLLAAAIEGAFTSFYRGKDSPLLQEEGDDAADASAAAADDDAENKDKKEEQPTITSVIERSPNSARLIVVGSSSFVSDIAIDFISQSFNTNYEQQQAFLENAIDWSLEDRNLLALRGRNQYARTLPPLSEDEQKLWEYTNYGFAALGLGLIWLWRRRTMAKDRARHAAIIAEI